MALAWSALSLPACGAANATSAESEPVSSSAAESYESEKFAYTWTLPEEWERIGVEQLGLPSVDLSIDWVAAKRKGHVWPKILLVVTDLMTFGPYQKVETGGTDKLAEHGAWVLTRQGAEVLETEHLEMLGVEAVQVNGTLANTPVSIRIFKHGPRRFEIHCYGAPEGDGPLEGSEWPCERAFTSLRIDPMPEQAPETTKPRVLHLRDQRFGIEYDAPDDSWLAIGPRSAGGGAQVVWIWANQGRQIDVQAFDLSNMPHQVSEAELTAHHADYFREKGATVVAKQSVLAGKPCHHLEISHVEGRVRDLFVQNRGDLNFTLLITQPKRDKALIEKLTAGFRVQGK